MGVDGYVEWTSHGEYGSMPAAKFCDLNQMIDFVDDFKNSMSEQKLSKKDKRNNGDIINN
jgi:hypothetical protein